MALSVSNSEMRIFLKASHCFTTIRSYRIFPFALSSGLEDREKECYECVRLSTVEKAHEILLKEWQNPDDLHLFYPLQEEMEKRNSYLTV